MNIPDFNELRQKSAQSLAQADNPKGMILFHTGIVLLLAAIITLVDYLLERANLLWLFYKTHVQTFQDKTQPAIHQRWQ